uniref:Uncharacterized protein n=1 Tax=Sus scrofa TaxID=9823 RepID=A0A8D1P4F0_PIG
MSCLYILEINPLPVALFANIFSHSIDCLFTLFMLSFLQGKFFKFLSLIRFHLFIFVFISITLGSKSKNISLPFMSKSVLPIFSSKSFIISGLTFKSLVHFEFIFVCGVRECSKFIPLHVAVQYSQHHLLKRLSFFHCTYSCYHCHRLVDHNCMGFYFWAFYPVLLIYMPVFVPVPYGLMTVTLCYSLKSGSLIPSVPFFLLKIALVFRVFCVSLQIKKYIYSSSVKNAIGILVGIESIDCLG